MNKKQIAYQAARGQDDVYMDLFKISASAFVGYYSVKFFSSGQIFPGIVASILPIYTCFHAGLPLLVRGLSSYELSKMKKDRKKYPLEYVDSVVIDDLSGLAQLLQKTAECEPKEWGTFLEAHHDDGMAIIHNLLDVKEASASFSYRSNKFIKIASSANLTEYNGLHHYHPPSEEIPRFSEARNFYIVPLDRFNTANWINLLTFNLPEGPELVAFNRQFTYIPQSKNNKSVLSRATPEQIMEYLVT
jgi:hypothetical protein